VSKPALLRRGRRQLLFEIAVALAGVSFFLVLFAPDYEAVKSGRNDFPAFYLAGHMLQAHGLYDPGAFVSAQQQVLGRTNANIQFVRLPYFAALLWPLGLLPFSAAYALWQALSLLALVAFVMLWPARWSTTLLVCCWLAPTYANLANAQDVTFLLLFAALAVAAVSAGRDVAAGLVLSLCMAKFHLFIFLPVVMVAGRMWRLAGGFVLGVLALLAACFAAYGPAWPLEYLEAVRSPAVHPGIARTSVMALAASVLHGPALVGTGVAFALLLGVAVYRIARKTSFPFALATAMAAGPLVAFHVYMQDYLLMLPLAASLIANAIDRPRKEAALAQEDIRRTAAAVRQFQAGRPFTRGERNEP
jgi:hypothetical protein